MMPIRPDLDLDPKHWFLQILNLDFHAQLTGAGGGGFALGLLTPQIPRSQVSFSLPICFFLDRSWHLRKLLLIFFLLDFDCRIKACKHRRPKAAENRPNTASCPAYLEERCGGSMIVCFFIFSLYGTAALPIPFNISQPVWHKNTSKKNRPALKMVPTIE